jgi:hypothetical protein
MKYTEWSKNLPWNNKKLFKQLFDIYLNKKKPAGDSLSGSSWNYPTHPNTFINDSND